MSEQALKELLKPPFKWDGYGTIKLTDIHSIQIHFHGKDPLNVALINFVVSALNEKYDRDSGEKLYWFTESYKDIDWKKCPKCKSNLQQAKETYHYCPSCHKKVFPPEGE